MKKLLAAVCALSLLGACATRERGADIYGDAQGGWNQDVNISDLKGTKLTKAFKSDTKDYVLFAFNSSSLDSASRDDLKTQVDWLKAHPEALVVIEGRCDERGTTEYNIALGERRANAARQYLVSHGISSNRIRTISYGKDDPVVIGSNEEAWAQNRRATTVAY